MKLCLKALRTRDHTVYKREISVLSSNANLVILNTPESSISLHVMLKISISN